MLMRCLPAFALVLLAGTSRVEAQGMDIKPGSLYWDVQTEDAVFVGIAEDYFGHKAAFFIKLADQETVHSIGPIDLDPMPKSLKKIEAPGIGKIGSGLAPGASGKLEYYVVKRMGLPTEGMAVHFPSDFNHGTLKSFLPQGKVDLRSISTKINDPFLLGLLAPSLDVAPPLMARIAALEDRSMSWVSLCTGIALPYRKIYWDPANDKKPREWANLSSFFTAALLRRDQETLTKLLDPKLIEDPLIRDELYVRMTLFQDGLRGFTSISACGADSKDRCDPIREYLEPARLWLKDSKQNAARIRELAGKAFYSDKRLDKQKYEPPNFTEEYLKSYTSNGKYVNPGPFDRFLLSYSSMQVLHIVDRAFFETVTGSVGDLTAKDLYVLDVSKENGKPFFLGISKKDLYGIVYKVSIADDDGQKLHFGALLEAHVRQADEYARDIVLVDYAQKPDEPEAVIAALQGNENFLPVLNKAIDGKWGGYSEQRFIEFLKNVKPGRPYYGAGEAVLLTRQTSPVLQALEMFIKDKVTEYVKNDEVGKEIRYREPNSRLAFMLVAAHLKAKDYAYARKLLQQLVGLARYGEVELKIFGSAAKDANVSNAISICALSAVVDYLESKKTANVYDKVKVVLKEQLGATDQTEETARYYTQKAFEQLFGYQLEKADVATLKSIVGALKAIGCDVTAIKEKRPDLL